MKLIRHSKVRTVGISSSLALLALLGLAVFCPSGYDESAQAAGEITKTGTFSLDFILQKTSSATFTIDFLLSQKLAIEISNLGTEVNAQPTPSGLQFAGSTTFTASTNNQAGLEVLVFGDGNSNLIGENSANTIAPVASANTALNAMNNQWGYNLQAGNGTLNLENMLYNPLPANEAAVSNRVHGNAGSTTYQLSFGAKVDNNTVPDTYKKEVSVKVVPSGVQITAVNEAANNLNSLNEAGVEEMNIENNILDIVTE